MRQAAHFEILLELPSLPFTLGATDEPHNPPGFPDTLPFTLGVDRETARVVQVATPEVRRLLEEAYRAGSLIGTAMDDNPIGKAYADDFLVFLEKTVGDVRDKRVLEIGAGRGYFVRLLAERGAHAVGLEPGRINQPHWERHNVDVIADMFPCAALPGPFDAIIAHAVLEHVEEPQMFLREIARHLVPGGSAVLCVPDASPYLETGDPSTLVHEHFSFFSAASLGRLLARSELRPVHLQPSGFGKAIYVQAVAGSPEPTAPPSRAELDSLRAFGDRCRAVCVRMEQLQRAAADAQCNVGVYCPSRALALLSPAPRLRFFDDDATLHGKYFPPFACPIEPRAALLAQPVDELWIISRTFGARLKAELVVQPAMSRTRVRTIEEILS